MSQFQLHVTYMQQLKQGMIDYMQNYDKEISHYKSREIYMDRGIAIATAETTGAIGKQNNVPSELSQPQSSQSGPGLTAQTALTIEITTPPNISIQPTLVISPL